MTKRLPEKIFAMRCDRCGLVAYVEKPQEGEGARNIHLDVSIPSSSVYCGNFRAAGVYRLDKETEENALRVDGELRSLEGDGPGGLQEALL